MISKVLNFPQNLQSVSISLSYINFLSMLDDVLPILATGQDLEDRQAKREATLKNFFETCIETLGET